MTSLNIEKLKELFTVGAQYISNNCDFINELNIFPVPDGDTGNNMKITTENAALSIANSQFNNLEEFAKVYSRALLMNARGNSGVIFTQIIKGFLKNFKNTEKEFSLGQLSESLNNAQIYAYRSLQNPVEGTILTVIRLVNEEYKKKGGSCKSFEEALELIVNEANIALNKTPEFLEDLKNANVVDSGGYGLVKFFEGMRDALTNKADKSNQPVRHNPIKKPNLVSGFDDDNEGFGYCCEFIMTLGSKVTINQKDKEHFHESDFKEELSKLGDCMVVVRDDNIIKVHLHTVNPYRLLEIGQRYGEFNTVKIENMTLQFIENNPGTKLEDTYKSFNGQLNEQLETKALVSNQQRVIATVPTQATADIYLNDLKVDYVINYEKSGNPSIQDFLNAFKKVKSQKIIIIIDDSNILLAAKEAVKLYKQKTKFTIISAKDIALSYLCALSYSELNDYDTNIKNMNRLTETTFARVAQSNKDVIFDKVRIKSNDYIGMIDKKIEMANANLLNLTKKLVDKYFSNKSLRRRAEGGFFYICAGINAPIDTTRKIVKHVSEHYGCQTKIINTNESVYIYHFVFNS